MSSARAPQIRWDRVGRVALLFLLIGIVGLYVRPALSYVDTRGRAAAQERELRRLQAEHRRLLARRGALRRPGTLEREARKLGYVKPGERAYVIEGLPR